MGQPSHGARRQFAAHFVNRFTRCPHLLTFSEIAVLLPTDVDKWVGRPTLLASKA